MPQAYAPVTLPPLSCADSDGPSARPWPPRPHIPAPARGEAFERTSNWSRRMGNGQDSLPLFSQQGLKCLCLAPAWPQLGTPGSISTEGAADVMQDPAGLKMGWETSVPSGTSAPPGGGQQLQGSPGDSGLVRTCGGGSACVCVRVQVFHVKMCLSLCVCLVCLCVPVWQSIVSVCESM